MPSGQVTTESQEITHKPAQIGHSNVNQARQPRKVLFTHESVESKVSSDQILFNQLEEAYQVIAIVYTHMILERKQITRSHKSFDS